MDDLKLRKAADARAQQESIRRSVEQEKLMQVHDIAIQNGKFELAQKAAQSAQQQVSFFNALQDVGAQPLPDSEGQSLQFSTHEEAERAAHDNPKFFIGDFKTRTAYDPGTGKYGIYRVPDTDVKNVQLTDQQGVTHTIPRMSAADYLDFQSRQQNLVKGRLGIEEARERLTQLREDRKSSSAYGKALGELDKVAGDADKLSPSSRTVLYTTASKNLGDAIRAKTAADKAEDAEAQGAASEAIQHYSGVLSQLHGRNPNAAQAGNVPSGMVQVQLPNGQVGNIPSDAVDAFMQKNPGAKKIAGGAAPTNASSTPISIQLADGSTIQTTPENAPKYLRSNKGARVADADQQRYAAWSKQQVQSDEEDRAAAAQNLQD
jgi:hypothetical protein